MFKDYVESIGYEAYRIKEKPEGGYNANGRCKRLLHQKKGNTKDEYVIENKEIKQIQKNIFSH